MKNLDLLLTLRPDPWLTVQGSCHNIVITYQDAEDYTFAVYGERSLADALAEADKEAEKLIEEVTK